MDIKQKIKEIPFWYHKIELPDGITTPGWSPICAQKYAIPDDLTGKRVLDIGSWDGYWTWEALKRGAKEVVAIDDFSDTCGIPTAQRNTKWQTFDLCREAFGFNDKLTFSADDAICSTFLNDKGQTCKRQEMSVYDIEQLGKFDIVFFFGTIYHLKHPLLALEKISAVCDGEIYVESAILDDFSPYKGGINKGYRNNDMVAEFYPTKEYGSNPSNWWNPTIQCLGYMVQSCGFNNIELWRLTENPKSIGECRGFVWGSKGSTPSENVKKQAYTQKILKKRTKVSAVMSVPRLGFNDNREAVFDSLSKLKIPLRHVYGVFWGQCLEKGFQTEIDNGAELILTIDYDTLFEKEDLQELLSIMEDNPDIDAIVPVQMKRGGGGPLATMKSITGQRIIEIPWGVFETEIAPIATGHFGLTLIRTSALMKMPHPWFLAEPDKDGQWGRDHTDDDIYFWRKFSACGNKVFLANRVTIGHLELMATWPDKRMEPIYKTPSEFHNTGKPKEVWK